jgi:hypothetical protein
MYISQYIGHFGINRVLPIACVENTTILMHTHVMWKWGIVNVCEQMAMMKRGVVDFSIFHITNSVVQKHTIMISVTNIHLRTQLHCFVIHVWWTVNNLCINMMLPITDINTSSCSGTFHVILVTFLPTGYLVTLPVWTVKLFSCMCM